MSSPRTVSEVARRLAGVRPCWRNLVMAAWVTWSLVWLLSIREMSTWKRYTCGVFSVSCYSYVKMWCCGSLFNKHTWNNALKTKVTMSALLSLHEHIQCLPLVQPLGLCTAQHPCCPLGHLVQLSSLSGFPGLASSGVAPIHFFHHPSCHYHHHYPEVQGSFFVKIHKITTFENYALKSQCKR